MKVPWFLKCRALCVKFPGLYCNTAGPVYAQPLSVRDGAFLSCCKLLAATLWLLGCKSTQRAGEKHPPRHRLNHINTAASIFPKLLASVLIASLSCVPNQAPGCCRLIFNLALCHLQSCGTYTILNTALVVKKQKSN